MHWRSFLAGMVTATLFIALSGWLVWWVALKMGEGGW